MERTPPNPALSEKLKNGIQSSSRVTSGIRIGICWRAARAHTVPDVIGISPNWLRRPGANSRCATTRKRLRLWSYSWAEAKTRVQMQTRPLGQLIHDCDLVLRTKQPLGKSRSRPLHDHSPNEQRNNTGRFGKFIANPKRSAVDHEVFPDSFVSTVTKLRNSRPSPPDCDRRHSKDRLTGYL